MLLKLYLCDMKLFAAVMPLFVVGISMVHYHPEMGEYSQTMCMKI